MWWCGSWPGKVADGRVEFGLRKVLSDGTLSGTLLPRGAVLPGDGERGAVVAEHPDFGDRDTANRGRGVAGIAVGVCGGGGGD